MMFAFLTMVTETDGKPANEYEYLEGAKPVYKKKLQGASRDVLDAVKSPDHCCIDCRSWCICCYA